VACDAAGAPSLAVAIWTERSGVQGPAFAVVGIVDSGAHRTLLPKQLAKPLGIKMSELTKDAVLAGGVKSKFTTWSSTVMIRAQVLYQTGPPSASTMADPTPWGPTFDLDAGFASSAPVLFGRADFFQAFDVAFIAHASDPFFSLTPRR
jgi:hypothetical protein